MRVGWTNERFAEFVLSQVSFISRPTTVGDDIGADFHCTLFESRGSGRQQQLHPRSPFLVQVKSSGKNVSLTKHLEYLDRLEIPFFVGVRDRRRPWLHLHSGRYMPYAFALKGTKLTSFVGRLTRARKQTKQALIDSVTGGSQRVAVAMPRVVTLKTQPSKHELTRCATVLERECREIALNNYHRLTEQFVFTFGGQRVRAVLAGPGSTKVFRQHFADRLLEYCRNLIWMFKYRGSAVRVSEVREILAVADILGHRLPKSSALARVLRELRDVAANGTA